MNQEIELLHSQIEIDGLEDMVEERDLDIALMKEALQKIVQRELDWSGDPHRCCVEMSDIAREALRAIEGEVENV